MITNWSAALSTFILAATLLTGCSLGKPGPASFASVVIPKRTEEQIQQAAVRVFREDGYAGGRVGPTEMVFQKEGTRGQNIAHAGVVGTHYGAQTLVRVRAEIVPQSGGSHRLQCQALIVTGAGDAFFEEEKRLTNMRSGPYQKLLDKVAASLK